MGSLGGYSGNLVRTYARDNDVVSSFTPDAGHAGADHGNPDPADAYRAARQVPPDLGAEYAGTSMPVDMANGYDLVLDTPLFTEPDAHDGPAWLGMVHTDDQFRELVGPEHTGEGEGAALRSTYEPPALQSRFEVYGDQLQQGFLAPEQVNTDALVRGINAYPQNNPPREGYTRGVRPGVWRLLTPNITRLQHRRRYLYDAQPLTDRDFLVPTDTDPQAIPSIGPVLPAWLPSRVMHRDTRPALWRRPEELDSDQLAVDQVDVSDVIAGDDVVG